MLIILALVAALTPGAVRPLTLQQICTIKWRLDRRHVTITMKRQVAASYHLPWAERGTVEFDHLVPRQLGGADVIANLWPQGWVEAHVKDVEENRLHRAVCAGTITLHAAQEQMRNWSR